MSVNKPKKYLYKYYKKKVKNILILLGNENGINKDEDIHQLRVCIKKIRMLFDLFEIIEPNEFKASTRFKLFSELFKQAGEIRENQLNNMYVDHYQFPSSKISLYKKFTLKNQLKFTHKLNKEIKNLDLRKIKKNDNLVKELNRHIDEKKIKKYLRNFILGKHSVIKKLAHTDENEDLHTIRKCIKSIHAAMNLLHKITPTDNIEITLTGLREIETMIGQWHDSVIFLHSFNKFLNKKINKSDEDMRLTKKVIDASIFKNNRSVIELRETINKFFDFKP